ncbi:cysteine hydrolase family protein [Paraburkholderia caballeronis]|uniref:Nicotinamidase-related amidase n=1 Tax=Paraburkholderia caballeronis TaxID=416943 RepID=A0A1H7LC68_9BURK|nr:cysteine hydrolase [Paraburkholderia caballeronis]PXW28374.1 nicotinamidase-related amidase [Paraburkholderia caballeronis]PXX03740.1 nicotinamidase-related amidase [Paraburkholderia caballeronis]RAK04484.1 nicotinamidase-related amidase [Paraburkholderia caballeronis]SED78317.1 Nicotinamidase-related amidase [Paraburkholderia caballeronis]SEK95937.1 Nicotinamidase-related amidase [Paraburkholderia caballeronis]
MENAANPATTTVPGALGQCAQTRWTATPALVDMTPPTPTPRIATLDSQPQQVRFDIGRSALVVIDMQNDFCTKGGWVAHLGGNYDADRAPIAPLQRLLPLARRHGVPVIWVNWGNRPDLANMPPNQLHLYKPTGSGIGLGEPLPEHGAHVLEKDSWAAAVVDELAPLPGDIRVDKYRISGFWDTPLDSILRNLGTRTIFFAGVNTDQCVLHTLTDANFLGYGCVMLTDCCATSSPDFCTEATVWNVKKCFGFVADSLQLAGALEAGGAGA